MSNYPPGVTGNEPQITGEYPCDLCGGCGYDEDEDGKHSCPLCLGTGIYPEDAWDIMIMNEEIAKVFEENGWGKIYIDTDDECLCFHTDLRIIGGSVVLRDE